MKILTFIKRKSLFILINIGIACLLSFVAIYSTMRYMNSYTEHGITIKVPDFSQLMPEDAIKLAEKYRLRAKVVDSLYNVAAEPGAVVEQYPIAGSEVKSNREIQLTIKAKNVEMVVFPQLNESPYRQTIQTLQKLGFEIGEIRFTESNYTNLVLGLEHNGHPIEAGEKMPKSSTIDLILGDGHQNNLIEYPNLIGKTLDEARYILQENYLNIGHITNDNTVGIYRNSARVYAQDPSCDSVFAVPAATFVKLRLTNDDNVINYAKTMATHRSDSIAKAKEYRKDTIVTVNQNRKDSIASTEL